MPQVRDYPQVTSLLATDAILLDRVGVGTVWITAADFSAITSAEYNVAMNFSGAPSASTNILTLVANQAFTLPESFTGSTAVFVEAPTEEIILLINQNGSSIGTITFPGAETGSSVGVFSGEGGTFASGDLLEIVTPTDLYGAVNIAITIAGSQSA